LNLSSTQEQMVWLIDFQGWSTSCISVKVTRDAAQVLQNHYPERLGLAVLYNPPKLFESFWTVRYHNLSCLYNHFFPAFVCGGGGWILLYETYLHDETGDICLSCKYHLSETISCEFIFVFDKCAFYGTDGETIS